MAPVAMGAKSEVAQRLVSTVGANQPPLHRARLVVAALTDPGGAKRSLSAHCEVAAMLADRLGCSAEVHHALAHAHERWDGAGLPAGLSGEAIPLAVRIAVVSGDADLWWRRGGNDVAEVLQARSGHAYDPSIARSCLALAPQLLSSLDNSETWEAMLAADPSGETIEDADLDRALGAVADFADLKSPWTRGHSPGVADVAASTANALGLAASDVRDVRRAALVHDLGRVGVPNGIWDRAGPLGVLDWERVRMHPYLTESTLACCPARLSSDDSLPRITSDRMGLAITAVGATCLWRSASWELPTRSWRWGRTERTGPLSISRKSPMPCKRRSAPGASSRGSSKLFLSAAGQQGAARAPRETWPAGLSDREVEVLRLLARGRTNKEIASGLYLSTKTVGRHVENIYNKIAVNSRAAAAVFAMAARLLNP